MRAWSNLAIGDFVGPVATWNPSSTPDGAFKYIDLSAVDQNAKLIVGARELPCCEAPSRARQKVVAGDILVSTVRPNLNGVARVPQSLDGSTASTGFCVLRPNPERLHGEFLFQWVKTPGFVADMVKKATGASYPAVSDRIILESRIPAPPLPEQRRIAEVLDRAEALRAKRRAALAQLDTLTQSIFLDLFGDPATNPKGVKVVRLADIATRITDGVHQKPNYTEKGIPFISVKDITTGKLIFDDCKFISLEDHERFTKSCKAERYDILYTKVGATYGRPAIVETDREFSIYVSVCLIKPRKELIDPHFLTAALGTAALKKQADRRIRGIGVPDLHLDQIQNFLIPFPPMNQQREFARQVAAIDKLRSAQHASLAQLYALFASLQHRAFRGEL